MSKIFDVAFKLGAELTGSFKSAFAEASKSMKGLDEVAKKTGEIGSAMTKGLTLPIVGLGAIATKTFSDFDDGMRQVAAISGATGSDFKKLSDKAKEVGATTKFSATESADALKYMAMAGWDTEQMLSGVDGVMSLAAASGEDLALTSDIVTDALTAFGMKAGEAGKFADLLASASSKSNTSVAMLGESFKYVAPLFGALGYSAEDSALALGLMANAGIKGSQAGTYLRTAIANMTDPTKEMASAMDSLGISLTDANGQMLPFKGVMDELRSKFSGLTKEQQAQYAATLFGKEAMSGMLAIVNASEEDYAKLTEATREYSGTAEEMAAMMEGGIGGSFRALKSAIEGLGISFGEVLAPYVKSAAENLNGLVTAFNSTSEGTKKIIIGVLAVVAAIGPLLLGFSKVVTVISGFKKSLAIAKGGFATLTGGATVAVGPILAVVAAVVAVIAIVKKMWRENEEFRKAIKNIWGNIQDIISGVIEKVKSIWESNSGSIMKTAQKVWKVIETTVMSAVKVIEGAVDIIAGVLSGDWSKVWEGAEKIVEGVVNFLKTVPKTILSVGRDMIIALIEGIEAAAGALPGKVDNLIELIRSGMEKLPTILRELGSKAIDKLLEGLGTIGGKVALRMSGVKQDIISSLEELPGTLKTLAENAASSFIENFITFADMSSKVSEFAQKIADGLDTLPEKLSLKAEEVVGGFFDSMFTSSQAEGRELGLSQRVEKEVSEMPARLSEKLSTIPQQIMEGLSNGFAMNGEGFNQSVQTILESPFIRIGVELPIKLLTLGPRLMIALASGILQGLLNVTMAMLGVDAEVVNGLQSTPEKIRVIGQTIMSNLGNAISSKIGEIRTRMMAVGVQIATALASIPGKMLQIGRDIVQGLINGLHEKLQAVKTKALEIANAVKNALTGAKGLDTNSPSRVTTQIGSWAGQGLVIGIDKQAREVMSSAKNMAITTKKGFSSGMDGLRKSASLDIGGLIGAVSQPMVQRQIKSSSVGERRPIAETEVSRTVMNSKRGGDTTIHVHFSPNYNIKGGDTNEVKRTVEGGHDDLLKRIRELQRDERRLAFE